VDLFAASHSVWLRTRTGIMFIPTGDSDVLLWPRRDGAWDVAEARTEAAAGTGRRAARMVRLHAALPMETAMAWCESEAEDRGSAEALGYRAGHRDATWRKRRAAATPEQLARCTRLRITVPGGATKAQVSDLLSVDAASRRIDPFVIRAGLATS
jgi:hypothetical protein